MVQTGVALDMGPRLYGIDSGGQTRPEPWI